MPSKPGFWAANDQKVIWRPFWPKRGPKSQNPEKKSKLFWLLFSEVPGFQGPILPVFGQNLKKSPGGGRESEKNAKKGRQNTCLFSQNFRKSIAPGPFLAPGDPKTPDLYWFVRDLSRNGLSEVQNPIQQSRNGLSEPRNPIQQSRNGLSEVQNPIQQSRNGLSKPPKPHSTEPK